MKRFSLLRVFDRLRIRPKVLVLVLLSGIVPLLIVGGLTDRLSSGALNDASKAKLEAVAAIKAMEVEAWFDERLEDAAHLSEDTDTWAALSAFRAAATPGAGSPEFVLAEGLWRSYLLRHAESFDSHDVYLVTASGDVVYSLRDEPSLGTNLIVGPYAETGLGVAFRGAIQGKTTFTDFGLHDEGSDLRAAFVAAPVRDGGGSPAGVIALEMESGALDVIMLERSGLGTSGETYIVGPDLLMRSASRFVEGSVLSQLVDTDAARAGLRGESGSGVIDDYRGVPVLSVWTPLDIAGLRWVLLAEQDVEEVRAPAVALRNAQVAIILAVAGLLALVALAVSRRIAEPVLQLGEALDAVSTGDVGRPVEIDARDEIGDMARSYERMRSYLSELAEATGRVAGGDLTVEVRPKSEQDALRLAFASMVLNLSRAEESLRESGERFRLLLDAVPDRIFRLSRDGALLDFHGTRDQWYLPPGEALGRNIAELIPGDVAQLIMSALDRALVTGEMQSIQYGLDQGAGLRNFEGRIVPSEENEAVVISRDVTAQLEAEAALVRSEASLTNAQRIAHLGSWDWDIVGGDLAWSDEIYRIFGRTPQEFGATYEAFLASIHPDDRDRVRHAVDLAVENDEPYSIEHRVVRPDGTERIVHERGEVARNDAGAPLRMMGTVQDVTDAERARRLERLLRNVDRAALDSWSIDDTLLLICQYIATAYDFPLVWVGLKEPDGMVSVRAVWGPASGYADDLSVRWDGTGEGDGPTGRAIRLGEPQAMRPGSPAYEPWRSRAGDHELEASCALPLIAPSGAVIGALNVYSRRAGEFDDERARPLELVSSRAAAVLSASIDREQLELQSVALETAANAIFITSLDGEIEWVNKGFTALTGYTAEEAIGQTPSILKSGEHDELHYRQLWGEIKAGQVYRSRMVNRRKDGSLITVEQTITPIRDSRRAIARFLAIQTDVTEARTLQRLAEAAAEEVTSVLTSAPNPIIVVDQQGTLLRANDAVREVFGWEPQDLVGQPLDVLVAGLDLGDHAGLIQRHIDGSAGLMAGRVRERVGQRKDGREFPAEVRVSEMPALDGVRRFIATIQDITERKQAERDRELARLAEVRARFLSTMSHELRTPLNSVLGFAQLLEREISGPLNGTQLRQVHDILESGEHLLSLINDVLDLSRIDAGRVELNPEPLDPSVLIAEVVRGPREMAARKGLDFRTVLREAPQEVVADRRALRQIVMNLVSNAVKFTDEGRIVVRARDEDSHLVLEVEDTGIGIAESDMEDLFEEFVQIDSGLSREHEGTGLGLAITRRLAMLHGGSISVDSAPGRGSTFSVRLPLRPIPADDDTNGGAP